jgi:hypothetical protein
VLSFGAGDLNSSVIRAIALARAPAARGDQSDVDRGGPNLREHSVLKRQ